MSRQKPPTSLEPGKSALTPTTAMGISATRSDIRSPPRTTHSINDSKTRVRSLQRAGPEVERGGGHGHAVAAELLRAGDHRRALQQVLRDLRDGAGLRR